MFQEWAVSQLAFNYRTLTLMVTFLAYLNGLDTRASIEGKRRVGGRFHCYKKLKSLNNTPHYHHGEWLQASTWVITEAPHCRRPGLPAPDSLLLTDNAAAAPLPSGGTAGTPLGFCPYQALYHFIKGWCLAQPRRNRSGGFVLRSARGSAAAFVLHNVFLSLLKGRPSQDYQPFNNFSRSPHCPKYTKGKNSPKSFTFFSCQEAQMQEKVKRAEWRAQRSAVLLPTYSARTDERKQKSFPELLTCIHFPEKSSSQDANVYWTSIGLDLLSPISTPSSEYPQFWRCQEATQLCWPQPRSSPRGGVSTLHAPSKPVTEQVSRRSSLSPL